MRLSSNRDFSNFNYRMKDIKFPWYLSLGRVGHMGLELTGQGGS